MATARDRLTEDECGRMPHVIAYNNQSYVEHIVAPRLAYALLLPLRERDSSVSNYM
jgi:hypothetical protein